MNYTEDKSYRKWILAALLTAAGVLLSPLFSFPLGVTRAFPLQHMINIFLAVLCGSRYSTSAAFCTSLIRNLLGTGSLLAFPGSMVGAFLSGFLYSRLHTLWAAVLGEFVGTSLIGGPLFYFLRRRLRHCLCGFEECPVNSNGIHQNEIKYSFFMKGNALSKGKTEKYSQKRPGAGLFFLWKLYDF